MYGPNDVPADDREPGSNPQPGVFNFAALKAAWRERDVLYASGTKYLTDKQIEAVRQFRLQEVEDLPVPERGRAAMAVLAWYPPEHGQGRR